MPTYAYACKDCGHRFEINQAFTDDALTTCPECEGRLRKIFNSVGVVFKGSGFYRNDSRNTGSSSTPASDGTSSDKDSGGAASKDTSSSKESSSKDASSTKAASSSGTSGSAA